MHWKKKNGRKSSQALTKKKKKEGNHLYNYVSACIAIVLGYTYYCAEPSVMIKKKKKRPYISMLAKVLLWSRYIRTIAPRSR